MQYAETNSGAPGLNWLTMNMALAYLKQTSLILQDELFCHCHVSHQNHERERQQY